MPFFEHGLGARMQGVEIVLAAALSPISGVTFTQQAKDLPASQDYDTPAPSSTLLTRFATESGLVKEAKVGLAAGDRPPAGELSSQIAGLSLSTVSFDG